MENKETEEIVFHDEQTPVEAQVTGPKNKLGIVSLVLAIIAAIVGFIPSESIILVLILFGASLGAIVTAIVSLVQIKKKNQSGKIFPIISIVVLIVGFILSMVISIIQIQNMSEEEYNDIMYCPYASECVDNKDGTSTCIYVNEEEIKCTTENLTEDQFK